MNPDSVRPRVSRRRAGGRPGPGPFAALRRHWVEYLIEGWALGTFMISAGAFTVLLESPHSPLHALLANGTLRRCLIGMAMGATAIALICSPWGRRSGAHMNPALTLTFWTLGKISGWDAVFYALAQFAGGTLGVLLLSGVLRDAFTAPPVRYIVTTPDGGVGAALLVECVMSAGMMWMVLWTSASRRTARWTAPLAGVLIAAYITLAAPISGMSINPARSFASAWPAHLWTSFWVYLTAPVAGMLAAAGAFRWRRGHHAVPCAKLLHSLDQRCIHCGYTPANAPGMS